MHHKIMLTMSWPEVNKRRFILTKGTCPVLWVSLKIRDLFPVVSNWIWKVKWTSFTSITLPKCLSNPYSQLLKPMASFESAITGRPGCQIMRSCHCVVPLPVTHQNFGWHDILPNKNLCKLRSVPSSCCGLTPVVGITKRTVSTMVSKIAQAK